MLTTLIVLIGFTITAYVAYDNYQNDGLGFAVVATIATAVICAFFGIVIFAIIAGTTDHFADKEMRAFDSAQLIPITNNKAEDKFFLSSDLVDGKTQYFYKISVNDIIETKSLNANDNNTYILQSNTIEPKIEKCKTYYKSSFVSLFIGTDVSDSTVITRVYVPEKSIKANFISN